jgi:hypothetical protein
MVKEGQVQGKRHKVKKYFTLVALTMGRRCILQDIPAYPNKKGGKAPGVYSF